MQILEEKNGRILKFFDITCSRDLVTTRGFAGREGTQDSPAGMSGTVGDAAKIGG